MIRGLSAKTPCFCFYMDSDSGRKNPKEKWACTMNQSCTAMMESHGASMPCSRRRRYIPKRKKNRKTNLSCPGCPNANAELWKEKAVQ